MPFHPRIEFALNRAAILGSGASDDLTAVLADPDAFEQMLRLSLDSISDPKKFRDALRREQRKQLQERLMSQHGTILVSVGDENDDSAAAAVNNDDDDDQDEADRRRVQQIEERGSDDGYEDDDNEEERLDKDDTLDEVQRIKRELHGMSLTLLDSLRMCLDVAKPSRGEEEEEEVEPDVRINNVSLLRFVLTILSDSAVATALRIPLLQGDLPLLTRAVLRCCCGTNVLALSSSSSTTASGASACSNAAELKLFADHRCSIIFLTLDAMATMCSDSAACRLSFACCVPLICAVLKTFVATPNSALSSSSVNNSAATTTTTPAVQKAKPVFVRPGSAQPQQSQQQQQQQEAAASAATTTTNDDVLFAAAAALETMLFHCPEAVEMFVDSDGIRTLVALFRQLSEKRRKEELKNNAGNNTNTGNGATETTAFIKRVLIHIRTCGAIGEDRWAAILGVAAAAAKNNSTSNNAPSAPLSSVFGRQGDDLAVDELKWALTGGVRLGLATAK